MKCEFLHARTGESGIRIAGRLRVAFAILYLYDLAIMGFWTIPMLILPSTGIIPYNTAMQCSDAFLDVKNTWTLFNSFPSQTFLCGSSGMWVLCTVFCFY